MIVQGRYDVVSSRCKRRGRCAKGVAGGGFRIVPDAGHSALELGNTHELISATDRFRCNPPRRELTSFSWAPAS